MTHMTDLIGAICEQLAAGIELDPRALAARLGQVTEPVTPDLPIRVVPFDASFSAAAVFAHPGTDQTSMVDLVPVSRLTLADMKEVVGPYRESPRLHPYDPRKFLFAATDQAPRPYVVDVMAYVSANEPTNESAPVQKLTIFCSPAVTEANTAESPSDPPTIPVWPRLLEERATFGVNSWRDATLEAVRQELEKALGVHFVPSHEKVYDGHPAFACALPACELRLNSWPSDNPNIQIFNFIGLPSGELDLTRRNAENIGEAIAGHLRRVGCDWYVADPLEAMEGGGTLGSRLLDRDVITSILAPRWLAYFDSEERAAGIHLLQSIADMWLSGARRTSNPIADVKRRWAEFEGWGRVPPRSRLRVLISYAIQEHLSMIEEELFQLKEMSATERAALPETSARLAAWRDEVVGLTEHVKDTHLDSIRRQHEEVLASIEELAEES